MGCNCGGAARRAITVTTANGQASVQSAERQPVPGMPRFKVTLDSGKAHEFATYQDARLFKAEHGGKLRAL